MGVLMAFLFLFVGMYSAMANQNVVTVNGNKLIATRLPNRLQAMIHNQNLANTLRQHYNTMQSAASTILNMDQSRSRTAGDLEEDLNSKTILSFPHPSLRAPLTYQRTPQFGQGMIRTPGSFQSVYGPRHLPYQQSPKMKRRVEFVDGALFKNQITRSLPAHVVYTRVVNNAVDRIPHVIETLGNESSQEINEIKDRSTRSPDSGMFPHDDLHDVIHLPLPSHLPHPSDLPPHILSHELQTQELTSDISPRQAVASLKTLLLTLTVLRNFDSQREEAKQILNTPGMAPSNMHQTKRRMFQGGPAMFRKRPFDSIANGLIGKRAGFRKRPFDPLANGLIGK